MEPLTDKLYSFGRFVFDADRLVLYHDGAIVKEAEKRSLQVLAVLLSRAGDPVSHEEIIDIVWSDNPHGATSTRVNQYVSRLRKTLAAFDAENAYIETLKGRGYRFVYEVVTAPETTTFALSSGIVPETPRTIDDHSRFSTASSKKRYVWTYLVLAVIAVAAVTASFWNFSRTDDVEDVKRVVKDSQMFESLVMYRDPSDFTEEMLDRYWLSESEGQANFDRSRIRQTVKKLLAEGRYYGEQTECLTFEFDKVELNNGRDAATVRTFEKWSLDDITKDGNISRKKTVGPYFVDYVLRKVNGRWLIERSTTARTVRPVPQLTSIEIAPNKNGGWLASVVGSDFEPLTIYFDIFGPDCTLTRPCRVENFTLRDRASMTSEAIWNIPIELAPGEYEITAKNGDSSPSKPLTFKIP
ncbi:MAG: winged helix-turn-helix domain-containing protein [Acidobacteriota bacterium]|nr:MAG: winged helix-turn-helix domain-containing protein [Acidobacteriota bacterium]